MFYIHNRASFVVDLLTWLFFQVNQHALIVTTTIRCLVESLMLSYASYLMPLPEVKY